MEKDTVQRCDTKKSLSKLSVNYMPKSLLQRYLSAVFVNLQDTIGQLFITVLRTSMICWSRQAAIYFLLSETRFYRKTIFAIFSRAT